MENKKDIDTSELESKLESLSGRDFNECEAIERRRGNYTPMISFSAEFQARIAAMALGTNIGELEELPIAKYHSIITRTANFLASTLAEEMLAVKSGE